MAIAGSFWTGYPFLQHTGCAVRGPSQLFCLHRQSFDSARLLRVAAVVKAKAVKSVRCPPLRLRQLHKRVCNRKSPVALASLLLKEIVKIAGKFVSHEIAVSNLTFAA